MRNPIKQNKESPQSVQGYTLIQLSVSIMIIGLMIAPALMIYNNYKKTQRIETTYKNISSVVDSTQLRRSSFGAYPCPAPMDAGRDDSTYGGALLNCPGAGSTAIATGTCASGICVEAGRGGARVLVGAVPFRELQLDETRAYDAYHSRLLFAVTESQTDEGTFNPVGGAIYIDGENGESVVEPEGSASFLVISPGPNGLGGYTIDGVMRESCAGSGRDAANCNPGFAGGVPKTEARYIAAYEYSEPGANYFDDQLSYFTQVVTPYWRATTDNQNDIQDLSPNNVGVGISNPTSELTISSTNDTLRVQDNLITSEICSEAGDCFEPSLFSTDPKINCPANTHMVGIADSQALCEPDTTPVPVECPSGKVLTGLNSDGSPICDNAPPKSCPATTASVCSANDSSADITKNGVTVPFNKGDCRTVNYTCNNGNWFQSSASGRCSFTPPVPDTWSQCGVACPKWYSGTYCNNYKAVCTGTVSLGNTWASDCTCVGGTESQTATCSSKKGSAWTGTATRTVTVSQPNCTADNPPWNLSACTCASSRADGALQWVPNGSCASGFSGTKEKEQKWAKATCSWVNTGATRETCACNTTPTTRNEDHSCADPTCEVPAKPDIWTIEVDPVTCEKKPEVKTTEGSCSAKSFQWTMLTATGAMGDAGTKVGTGCGCQEYKSATTKICNYPGDPNKYIYNCRCQ